MGSVVVLEDYVGAEQENGISELLLALAGIVDYLLARVGINLMVEDLDKANHMRQAHGPKLVDQWLILQNGVC